MAIIKFIYKNDANSPYGDKYRDDLAISTLIRYVFNYGKTHGYIGGWGVDVSNAAYEMELLSALYHKRTGIRLRQWVISFNEMEATVLAKAMACGKIQALQAIGFELSYHFANRFQIVFGIHNCPLNPHIHFVMNNVSYVDGYKYSGSKKEYREYINYCKGVLRQYGLHLQEINDHTAKGLTANDC